MHNIPIKDIPEKLRPYEKCMALGCEALTDAELLSIIIRTGTKNKNSLELASDILSLDKGSEGLLSLLHCSREDLMSLPGVGSIKAMQLQALVELSRRIWKTGAVRKLDFHDPETIASYYMEELRHLECEIIKAVYLDSRDGLIADSCVSLGTVNSSLTSAREIFIDALKHRAVSLIVLHNHPSGEAGPSRQDIAFTKNLWTAGRIVGIELLDHIIIGDNTYYSFRERGILTDG